MHLFSAVRRLRLLARRVAGDRPGGRAASPSRGAGLAFDSVREYADGDDPRLIDWNVTARAGRPFVKQFTEERERTVWIVADVSASTAFGPAAKSKRHVIGEAAALLAFAAAFGHDRPGLVLVSDRVERRMPPGRGLDHAGRIATAALAHQPAGRLTRLKLALEPLRAARRGLVYVLSDFQDADFFPTLRTVARRHAVTAVIVFDPAERELPRSGLLDVADAESGERMTIDTHSPAVRSAYAENARRRAERLRHDLRAAGVDCLELSTAADAAAELMAGIY